MEEIIKFLNENSTGSLATVDNGKPRVRPWGFMLEEDGKFYFCTANTKDVYTQMKNTPFIEFTATSKDMVTVRLSGPVTFINDMHMKEKVLNSNPGVKSLYKSADNPVFEVFYIGHGEIIVSDFTGNPPRKFSFS